MIGSLSSVLSRLPFVHRGDQHFRVFRRNREVNATGFRVDEEDLFPGLAAVDGLEDAAFGVLAPKPAEGADVDDVWVVRMDDDFADLERLAKPHVLPCLAAVDRPIDAVAPRGGVSRVVFARADPDDVVDCSARRRRRRSRRSIRGRTIASKRGAGVRGLEESARGAGDVPERRVFFRDGQIDDAAAHRGRADRVAIETLSPKPGRGPVPLSTTPTRRPEEWWSKPAAAKSRRCSRCSKRAPTSWLWSSSPLTSFAVPWRRRRRCLGRDRGRSIRAASSRRRRRDDPCRVCVRGWRRRSRHCRATGSALPASFSTRESSMSAWPCSTPSTSRRLSPAFNGTANHRFRFGELSLFGEKHAEFLRRLQRILVVLAECLFGGREVLAKLAFLFGVWILRRFRRLFLFGGSRGFLLRLPSACRRRWSSSASRRESACRTSPALADRRNCGCPSAQCEPSLRALSPCRLDRSPCRAVRVAPLSTWR